MANWMKKCIVIAGVVLCFMFVIGPITNHCNADWGIIKQIFEKSDHGGGGGNGNSVPEPSTLLLLAAGGGALFISRRFTKK